ncbi:hypothetical protein IFM89_006048 [Coptis chinensis]|uniref:Uncharacterized protein n=1 Tax=Coptis chinensis TaxID=261450 RepID=A0A835I0D0_9MAGN|nr:hypothetical protein IFM89_006048 [Coptis chinensis]
MADNLFLGLPPPSSSSIIPEQPSKSTTNKQSTPPPAPILKSALKRKQPPVSQTEEAASTSQKGVKFKTTVEASETQVIEAMQKIASHIKNPAKFSKASKLAVQLIQAGSVKPGTVGYFFDILEAAMSSATACTQPSLRTDYHALFTVAQDVTEFSKAAGQIKEIISSLPVATKFDDVEEAEILKDENAVASADGQGHNQENVPSAGSAQSNEKAELDPFGLDALLSGTSKKDERSIEKKESFGLSRKAEEEESKRFLRSKREALILCLDITARRYRIPWCQTVIDILVKHAFDNIDRFTTQQRCAIEKLWASIHEQQTRRRNGKSVTGKLDMNGFEWLQQKYASEKISIRNSVGGASRRAEQWLG